MDDNTPPFDPFSEPPRTPAMTEVLVEPAMTKPRRTRLAVGVAAAVAAVVAVVAVLVVTGGNKADAYSLQAAADNARAADRIAFTMSMGVMGTSVDMSARFDKTAKLMALSTDLAAFGAGGDGGEGGTIEMVLDLGAARMYMDASTLGADAVLATKWISIDMSKMPGFEESLGALTGSNPLDAASLFDNAKNVTDLGLEDLDGEQVKHYRVSVPMDDVKKAQPGVFDQLGAAAADLPDTIDYDVWVTKGNEFRRMSLSFDLAGSPVTTEMRISAVDDIEPIVVPADSDVTDMTDLIGSGLQP